MNKGIIKFVSLSRGFGFIRPDVEGEDVFFHKNSFEDKDAFNRILAGDKVSYEMGEGRDGRSCATRVIVQGVTDAETV